MKYKILIITLLLSLISKLNCYYYENNANYDNDNNDNNNNEFNKDDGGSVVHVPPDLLISTENTNDMGSNLNEKIECKTDFNCISSHSICLNGNCVRICNNNNKQDKQQNSANCIYFHCDSKLLIYSDNYYLMNKKLNNLINNSNYFSNGYYNMSSNLLFTNNNRNANFLIETNNYPLLNRYLSKKKCSWILKHRLKDKDKEKTSTKSSSTQSSFLTSPFIKLKFNRFSTELSNDFLYIFAGDSIYSPLIAALSGDKITNLDPGSLVNNANNIIDSLLSQKSNEINETNKYSLNITFFNTTSLYLLFKSDVTSLFSSLNSFTSQAEPTPLSMSFDNEDVHKPSGISVKYKFSSGCRNNSLMNETDDESEDCYEFLNGDNCTECNKNSLNNDKETILRLVESIDYIDDENRYWKINLNSTLRRAYYCSFEYKSYFYVVGGYSFRSVSFMSRLNLIDYKWEHSFDRRPVSSHAANRSNRRFYSSQTYKQNKLDFPQNRYAHSCVLDEINEQFYMYGGIKFQIDNENPFNLANKQTTNELWSYNLVTNKWLLMNQAESTASNLKNFILPLPISGHSMHLINNNIRNKIEFDLNDDKSNLNSSLFILFGYSEYYGATLNIIQEFNLLSRTWHLHNITSNINIGFGHSSIHDRKNNVIYFNGGLMLNTIINTTIETKSAFNSLFDAFNIYSTRKWPSPSTPSSASSKNSLKLIKTPLISSMLYSFHIKNFEWRSLTKSSQSSYMQSCVLYKSLILFYGGININDDYKSKPNVFSTYEPYKSNELKAFSINENKWLDKFEIVQNETDIFNFNDRKSISSINLTGQERYAHRSFIFNHSLYIFGGFNGFFLNDLFKINLAKIKNFYEAKEVLNFFIKRKRHIPITSNDEKNMFEYNKLKSLNFQSLSSQQIYEEDAFGNKVTTRPQSDLIDFYAPNHDQPIDFISVYNEKPQAKQKTIIEVIDSCNRYTSCHSCQMNQNCVWNFRKCEFYSVLTSSLNISDLSYLESLNISNLNTNSSRVLYKKPICPQICSEYKSCANCTTAHNQYQSDCVWCASQSKCLLRTAVHIYFPFGDCVNFISERSKCERNLFAFNTAHSIQPVPSSPPQTVQHVHTICSIMHSNCSSCVRDERCGWCTKDSYNNNKLNLNDLLSLNSINGTVILNYNLNTGYGSCMEGGETHSIGNRCTFNWFFTKCPSCECNGHSTCSNSLNLTQDYLNDLNKTELLNDPTFMSLLASSTSLSCGKCLNNTEGEYCSDCRNGYYGNAKNNGACRECECGVQADTCDPTNGRCFCNTKGVVGFKCDQCDSPRYMGRPNMTDGSCFYNLTTDYQFTFNLNKDSDRHYTRINFVNHPLRGNDDDIDFMVRCIRENAVINITYLMQFNQYDYDVLVDSSSQNHQSSYNELEWPFNLLNNLTNYWLNINDNQTKGSQTGPQTPKQSYSSLLGGHNYYFGPLSSQVALLKQINCTSSEFKYTFSNRDLNYADKNHNAVFIVYVYDFQTPITIQIAFSRRSRVQLLHFFITFFGCLLSLLTIAFITWKSKQRYDRFRRQRQIVIQMEHMASRPFTRLLVDITKPKFLSKSRVNLIEEEKIEVVDGKTESENKIKNITESSNSNSMLELKYKKNVKKKGEKSKKLENKNGMGFYLNSGIENMSASQNLSDPYNSKDNLRIMPVAVEPLSNNKTALVTCLLKLPQGDLNYTPKGSSPFVLASAYVHLNSTSSLMNIVNNATNGSDMNILDDEEPTSNDKLDNKI